MSFAECEKIVYELMINNLIDGIEAFYKGYSKEENDFLKDLADKYNLLISAGSDYHGRSDRVSELGVLTSNNCHLVSTYLENREKLKIICIDGLSGSGKSTQVDLLKRQFEAEGKRF